MPPRTIFRIPCVRYPVLFRTCLLAAALMLQACGEQSPLQDPQAAAEHYAQARSLQTEGEYEAAIVELKNAVQLHTGYGEARRLLAEIYLASGENAAAEKEFEWALEAGVSMDQVRIPLAEALIRQEKAQDLLNRIDVSPLLPNKDQAHLIALQGFAYLMLDKQERAREVLAAALELDPECVPALLGRAMLDMQDERYASAESFLEQTVKYADGYYAAEAWALKAELRHRLGDLAGAEGALTRAIEPAFDKVPLWVRRALVRIDLGDPSGAEEDLKLAGERVPNSLPVLFGEAMLAMHRQEYGDAHDKLQTLYRNKSDSLPVLLQLGIANFHLDDFEQAIRHLSEVVELDPKIFRAAKLLGAAHLALADFYAAGEVLEPLVAALPEDAEAMNLLARAYIGQGKPESALALLERSVTLAPDVTGSRIQLGTLLLQQGEPAAGITNLEQAVALEPQSRTARVALMRAYLRIKNFTGARELAEQFRREEPERVEPLNFLGVIHTAEGDYPKARESFERALQLDPGDLAVKLGLAGLERQHGGLDKAREFYLEILGKDPQHLPALLNLADLEFADGNRKRGRELLEQAVNGDPSALQPRLRLTQLYLQLGQPAKALPLLQSIQERYPDDLALLGLLGETQFAVEDYSAARRSFEQWIKLSPDDAGARYALARACADGGQYACLRDALMAGLERNPVDPSVPRLVIRLLDMNDSFAGRSKLLWQLENKAPQLAFISDLRGQLAMQMDRPDLAVKIFQQLVERDPGQWDWQRKLAKAHAANNDPEGELDVVERWLQRYPDDARAHFQHGEVLMQQGRDDDALSAFSVVLQSHPDSALTLNSMAWLLRASDPHKALGFAERAVELLPRFDTRDTLAVILLELGQNERAERLLRQALEEEPWSPDIRTHLARALIQLERPEQARALLKEILQAHASFAERASAEALLGQLP